MDIKAFRGLNNVSDPMRLDMSWLVQADNVNITDTGAIAKREGYSLLGTGNATSAFSTFDFSRMFVIFDGVLSEYSGVALTTVDPTKDMHWCEVNDQVFYNNGTDSGVILPDNTVLPWRWPTPTAPSLSAVTGSLPEGVYQVRCTYTLDDGRETGTGEAAEIVLTEGQALQISDLPGALTNIYIAPANTDVFQLYATTRSTALVFNSSPDTLGRDLLNAFLDPLPQGADVVQVWQGRAYAAEYMPTQDQTALWFSEPLAFHLFNLNSNFILVPGRVLMLAPHEAGLIIGTESRVYSYSGAKLEQLAEYGVVPGRHWSKDEERILFWSTRGLCSTLPFQNLTEKQVSVAPGVKATGCVIRSGGQKRYLTVLQRGGEPFNVRPLPAQSGGQYLP